MLKNRLAYSQVYSQLTAHRCNKRDTGGKYIYQRVSVILWVTNKPTKYKKKESNRVRSYLDEFLWHLRVFSS